MKLAGGNCNFARSGVRFKGRVGMEDMPMSRLPETTSARELAGRLGLHRAGREWRGACPCCSYPDAFVLAEKQGRVLGWCASCQDREGVAGILRAAGALPERRRARCSGPPRSRCRGAAHGPRAGALVWSGARAWHAGRR